MRPDASAAWSTVSATRAENGSSPATAISFRNTASPPRARVRAAPRGFPGDGAPRSKASGPRSPSCPTIEPGCPSSSGPIPDRQLLPFALWPLTDNGSSDPRQLPAAAAEPAPVGDGPVQPALQLLHAGTGLRLAAARGHPAFRGDREAGRRLRLSGRRQSAV